MSDDAVTRIESKLAAVLAIQVDLYLRETGLARPRTRSIDKMLADVGVPTKDIAALLGKTDRAVQIQLQKERATRQKRVEAQPAQGETE